MLCSFRYVLALPNLLCPSKTTSTRSFALNMLVPSAETLYGHTTHSIGLTTDETLAGPWTVGPWRRRFPLAPVLGGNGRRAPTTSVVLGTWRHLVSCQSKVSQSTQVNEVDNHGDLLGRWPIHLPLQAFTTPELHGLQGFEARRGG